MKMISEIAGGPGRARISERNKIELAELVAQARPLLKRMEELLLVSEVMVLDRDSRLRIPGQLMQIMKATAHYYDLNVKSFKCPSRTADLAWARQVVMFLARELTAASLNDIGAVLGGRDHGTVLYGFHAVKDRCEVDDAARASVQHLRASLVEILNLKPVEVAA